MLELHAAHLRAVNERSAGLAWTVEQAVPSDVAVARLWDQMNRNRTYAVGWAASTLLAKPGRLPRVRRRLVEATFWVALDWGTYRTLTAHAGLRQQASRNGCAATTRPRSWRGSRIVRPARASV